MSLFLFLLPAFVACILFAGIHTYLGVHVISRGIIFIDLALAQLAALGMTVAVFLGYEVNTWTAYFFALSFALLGSLFFTFFRGIKIHQEALIGVVFAISTALSILIADKIPHGGEHLKYILNGSILWVSWPQIVKVFLIYSGLGVVYSIFGNQLLAVSLNVHEAKGQGLHVKALDLLFYATFSLVITNSVQMGGILLVFSFLIVPALTSMMFAQGLFQRVLLGWLIGAMTGIGGILFSYAADLPTGATVVASFGGTLAVATIVKSRMR
ncbi:MAG: hypothetical protein A3I75_04065 [Deltaproteobacteria bacterium RIFCSPLOWO2_02_FULL_50_16]|nr:MAG: hypothetical protein A3I75_04065 [Deltaproteobacteria bacterium RIFCSPLOWO2_02_FULL_50_16]OGQ65364.1 MAG: hypothetical protein A3F89_07095 [Deltaproteobacteria bacterium RIFCSPLOWO2_12_FULL_50_11]